MDRQTIKITWLYYLHHVVGSQVILLQKMLCLRWLGRGNLGHKREKEVKDARPAEYARWLCCINFVKDGWARCLLIDEVTGPAEPSKICAYWAECSTSLPRVCGTWRVYKRLSNHRTVPADPAEHVDLENQAWSTQYSWTEFSVRQTRVKAPTSGLDATVQIQRPLASTDLTSSPRSNEKRMASTFTCCDVDLMASDSSLWGLNQMIV